jgi:hypothetical protein
MSPSGVSGPGAAVRLAGRNRGRARKALGLSRAKIVCAYLRRLGMTASTAVKS